MSGIGAIQGVDRILRQLTLDAVVTLNPKPDITVGSLDRDDAGLRLNWFLYRVRPDPSYRNMEPPQRGWRTARGQPPLALRLSYLLSAFPASTQLGDEEQFAHNGLAAAARALHENAIIGESSPLLASIQIAPLLRPLVEPIRIVMDDLDLEAITKLWTACTKPIRLSIGYEVSVVLIDSTQVHVAGPPVQTRDVVVLPTMGPRLVSVTPARTAAGETVDIEVLGLTAAAVFTLAHEIDDPPGGDWPMTVVTGAPPGHVHLQVPDPRIAPGLRRVDVTVSEGGLVVGHDLIGLTVVPVVTGPAGPLSVGNPVSLSTAHAAPDVEVFLRGQRLAGVTFLSATQVDVVLPVGTAVGPADLMLRAGKLAGPARSVTIA